MLIISEKVKSHLLIHITEDILMDNSRDFFLEFESIFNYDKSGLEFMTVDFSEVRFLDSSGIGSIIKCTNKAKESGIKVFVINLNKTLLSVFRLSGLDHILISMEIRDFNQEFPEFKDILSKYNV
jgi:stage II sporulation protein AA (anti-sigma F factor antagonist)